MNTNDFFKSHGYIMTNVVTFGRVDLMAELYKYHQQRGTNPWLWMPDAPLTSLDDLYTTIMTYGDLSCLKFAIEHGCPVDQSRLLDTLILPQQDTLNCLKYLHKECGLRFTDSEFCIRAAEYGLIDHLMYAHENGCPWDPMVCAWASLPILQYAFEHGCPWDARTLSYSIIRDDDLAYQYAVKHGLTWDGYSISDVIHDYCVTDNDNYYWEEPLELFHKCIELGCPVGDIDNECGLRISSEQKIKGISSVCRAFLEERGHVFQSSESESVV